MKLTHDTYRSYLETTYASWLGKNIGVRLGAPVEGWTHRQITEKYGHISGYVTDYDVFAADDDTNGPLFFVRCLLDKNNITPEDVGETFLNYIQEYSGFFWWGGPGVSSEHTAYENLKRGIKAPLSGSSRTNGIAIAEQIGGQIFSDCWGYVSGYDPVLAAGLAAKASSVTHDGNGIQGGIFVAVAICLAYQYEDIRQVIDEALEYLDHRMKYYRVCRDIIRYHDEHPDDWHDCLKYIQDNYGYDRYPGVCHIIPNSALMIMAMCYGNGDFSDTLNMLCEAGWDTDCNCGNIGSIMGALKGLKGIDDSWIRPINDVVNASSCVGCLNLQTISQSAELFADLAMKLQGLKAPEHGHFELPHAMEGFRSTTDLRQEGTSLVTTGDGELYQFAYYLPDDIYDARYDPVFSPIYYPGDTVSYDVQGTSACIFVQDCQGKRYCSDEFDVRRRKMISWQLPEGCNLTVNRIGLVHEGELCLYDMDVRRHAVLDIDFHGYPIDRLGPRYGGDYMENVRGFVPHSGKWQVTGNGLQGSSEEHALITTGHLENEIEELEMVAETADNCSFGLIWGFHGFRQHNRLVVENNTLKVMRVSGDEKETIISASITLQKGKNSLKVRYRFDNIIVYFNSASFVVQKSSELTAAGAIGSVIEGPGKVLITGFKLRSSI